MPLHEGLTVVKGLLRGAGFRTTGSAGHNGHPVKIISSGRVVNGFDLVRLLALGADICNSARAMMFALGCIQALMCNTNKCPTGIATSKPHLMAGLDVDDKAVRVAQFQAKTVHGGIGAYEATRLIRLALSICAVLMGSVLRALGTCAELPIGSLTDGVTGREGQKKPVFEKWWDAGGAVEQKPCHWGFIPHCKIKSSCQVKLRLNPQVNAKTFIHFIPFVAIPTSF